MSSKELYTIGEAADYLNVSKDFVVKQIWDSNLIMKRDGVTAKSLFDLKSRLVRESKEAIKELTRLSEMEVDLDGI